MLQVKLIPLPVPNGAWVAHFQYGKFGLKEDGDYRSGSCVLTPEQAKVVLNSNSRSVSYRYGSAEPYFREDASESEEILFGGTAFPVAYDKIWELLDSHAPINPEFQTDTHAELSLQAVISEKRHKDFAAQKGDETPETIH